MTTHSKLMDFQDPNFWKSRPLSEMMIRAATDDVRFLLNIHEKMMEKLSKVSLWRLAVRSELYCRCFCINDNEQADWTPLPTIPGECVHTCFLPFCSKTGSLLYDQIHFYLDIPLYNVRRWINSLVSLDSATSCF